MLDRLIARLGARDPMFVSGWGDESALAALAEGGLRPDPAPGPLSIEVLGTVGGARELAFESPVPWLPREVARGRARHLPARGRDALIVLASSREEGYSLREAVWAPLATGESVDVFLLENAYYGTRRASGQRSASLPTVLDQMRMNVATLVEVDALVRRLTTDGFARVCVTGYSMGGAMAALAGSLVRRPIAALPMAATLTPATIYTEGLLSRSVAFHALGPTADEGRRRLADLFATADMSRFPPPLARDAAIVVGARADGFVAPEGTTRLARHWGAELRWVRGGHASALFTARRAMRRAALDALARLPR